MGKPIADRLPAATRSTLGIGMVHQHFMLIPVMTVAENIVLAVEPRHGPFLDHRRGEERVRDLSQRYGLAVDPDAQIEAISVGQQQRVEILKALYRGAEILILDEPTAVLTPQEASELFEIVRSLTERGQVDHLHHAQAQRGARHRRPHHRAPPRQADRDGPARRRDAGEPCPADGRPRGAPASGQDACRAGRAAAEVEDLRVFDDRGLEAVRGVSASRFARARSSASPASTATARPSSSTRSPACAGPAAGRDPRRRKATSRVRPRATRLDEGLGHIPEDRQRRGLVLDFSLAENLALHDFDEASQTRGSAGSTRAADRTRGSPAQGVRRPRRQARRRSQPRFPAATSRRSSSRARSRATRGCCRSAADARPRRRRDRVRPPPPRRGARRGPRRSCSSRSSSRRSSRSPTASSSSTRARSSASTAPDVSEEELGIAMTGGRPRERPRDRAAVGPRRQAGQRRAGERLSALTVVLRRAPAASSSRSRPTVLAFFVGGIVVARDRPQPARRLQGDLRGHRPQLVLPVARRDPSATRAASDLQQTLIITTPLILTRSRSRSPSAAGMFNIGGQGQYWVGLIAALYVGTHLAGLAARRSRLPRPRRRASLAGFIWGGIAGFLKATVGAHEVISTIMLNWIAHLRREVPLRAQRARSRATEPSIPRSTDIADSAQLWPIWGAASSRSTRGIFIALSALVVYHFLLNRTTLGYEVRAVGFNPEAARYGGISVAQELLPRARDLGRVRRASRAPSTCSAGSTAWRRTTSTPSRSGFVGHRRRPARAEQGGRDPLRGAPLRRAPGRHVDRASSIPRSSRPSSPATSRR